MTPELSLHHFLTEKRLTLAGAVTCLTVIYAHLTGVPVDLTEPITYFYIGGFLLTLLTLIHATCWAFDLGKKHYLRQAAARKAEADKAAVVVEAEEKRKSREATVVARIKALDDEQNVTCFYAKFMGLQTFQASDEDPVLHALCRFDLLQAGRSANGHCIYSFPDYVWNALPYKELSENDAELVQKTTAPWVRRFNDRSWRI